MANPEEIRVDIVHVEDRTPYDAEAERSKHALEVSSLLRSWRCRFAAGDDQPVSGAYDFTDGGHAEVLSTSLTHLHIGYRTSSGQDRAYEFNGETGELKVHEDVPAGEDGEPAKASLTVTDDLSAYVRAGRIVFDCDQAEARGR